MPDEFNALWNNLHPIWSTSFEFNTLVEFNFIDIKFNLVGYDEWRDYCAMYCMMSV